MNAENVQKISVIDPISKAMERTKLILFKPFDIGKWFTIGFCLWLANMGQGGNFPFNFSSWRPGDMAEPMERAREFFISHLPLVITIGSGLVVSGIAILVVSLWLSSRGRFMFIHCIAENKGEVKLPWRQYKRRGNSLFGFRLTVRVIGFVCIGLLVGIGVLMVILFKGVSAHTPVAVVLAVIANVFVMIPIAVGLGLILKFTKDFVVPMMMLFNCKCTEAWGRFWELLKNNKGHFTLYLLFQIVIGMAIGGIIIAAMCVTCCIAACVIMIPFIGTVFLLPVFVFSRSYSLYYLAQYGAGYDVFATAAPQMPVEPGQIPTEPTEQVPPRPEITPPQGSEQ